MVNMEDDRLLKLVGRNKHGGCRKQGRPQWEDCFKIDIKIDRKIKSGIIIRAIIGGSINSIPYLPNV